MKRDTTMSTTTAQGTENAPKATLPSSIATIERKTLSVPEAGLAYFGLAKDASYNAARRGQIPVIKMGRTLRVPIVLLERMLLEAGK
jgi:hypothetical protein